MCPNLRVCVCSLAERSGERRTTDADGDVTRAVSRYARSRPDLVDDCGRRRPAPFKAATLAGALFAQHRNAEVASLERRYGAQRVTTFLRTFDTFVDRAIHIVVKDKIPLPAPQLALAHDPYELAASLRAAGVMSDGRFDVGYFSEHLLSRPMHKTLMDEVNADPQYGPAVNADFHVILTAMMDDLKTVYNLPR